MKNKDPDYIAKLEKAIADKYDKETIAVKKRVRTMKKKNYRKIKTNYRRHGRR